MVDSTTGNVAISLILNMFVLIGIVAACVVIVVACFILVCVLILRRKCRRLSMKEQQEQEDESTANDLREYAHARRASTANFILEQIEAATTSMETNPMHQPKSVPDVNTMHGNPMHRQPQALDEAVADVIVHGNPMHRQPQALNEAAADAIATRVTMQGNPMHRRPQALDGPPEGWNVLTGDHGQFYENPRTGETMWPFFPGSPTLPRAPEGWEVHPHDEGGHYFHNPATKKSQWDHPTHEGTEALTSKALPAPAGPLAEPLAAPDGWEVHPHDEGGYYFHNPAMKETQWDHPTHGQFYGPPSQHAEHGQYYHNPVTKETLWTRPGGEAVAPDGPNREEESRAADDGRIYSYTKESSCV